MKAADEDTLWASASVAFVFFYFMFYMKSFILAFSGVTLIAFAFPLNAIIN